MRNPERLKIGLAIGSLLVYMAFCSASRGGAEERPMEITAYCGCGECCGWERGNWKFLKLDQWNRYVSNGPRAGCPYDGKTASGTKPRQSDPGLFSVKSIKKPWTIPFRMPRLPLLVLPEEGTIAADTSIYPVGTKMKIPGYGWGVVEDRGSAIKGPERLDIYMRSHRKALEWGRRTVPVEIRLAD
jgi:hypothetical protein